MRITRYSYTMYVTETERQNYIDRAQMLINNVRLMNNGADIHTVANIRTSAQLFTQILTNCPNMLTKEYCDRIIDGITKQCSELFHSRFGY